MDTLLDKFDAHFSEATLKPSSGGRFEVSVDGTLVYSKLKSGRFPTNDELREIVAEQIGAED